MKSPAFQFYPAEWLADEKVQCLSLEEEGAYIRLICYCWREGSIPSDSSAIAQLCKGCSSAIVSHVAKLFDPDPNDHSRLLHKRLERERQKQLAFSKERRESGLRGSIKRWGNKVNSQKCDDGSAIAPEDKEEVLLYGGNGGVGEGVIPDFETAFTSTITVGIDKEFCRYVYDEWSTRGGRDASQCHVPFLRYVTKRWNRERAQWVNGSHNGNRSQGNNIPITMQIKATEKAIAEHPANRQSIFATQNPTDLQKASLRELRGKLKNLYDQCVPRTPPST